MISPAHRAAAPVCALFLLLLFGDLQSTTLTAGGAEPFDGFEPFVESVMKEWNVPGVAVGAIKDGHVVLAKGFGYRDVDRKLPVTPRTVMAIGSNTKSFTVLLMGMLSDEKKLDWDTPVRAYLPDFELQDDVATRLVTPTDLVTHRSGLPRHDLMWLPAMFSRAEMYTRLRHLEPSATFRQRYQYNNLMYMTAGHLVERISARSWDDLIKERIFSPLGMTASNTSVRDTPSAADYALPYRVRDGRITAVPFRNIDAVAPAGSINSNIDEMLRYVQMHIDGGTAGGQTLVSKTFSARMQSLHSAPAVSIDLEAPTYTEMGPGGYGMGVNVRSYRGRKFVDHTGSIDGFQSMMSWMPHERIGVVVLTNQTGDNPTPHMLALNVYERLLALSLTDHNGRAKVSLQRSRRQAAEREKKRQAERVAGTSPSRPLAQFAGTYEHPAYGALTIAEKEGRLTMTRGIESTPLEHYHYDVFEEAEPNTLGLPRSRVVFTGGASGKIETVAIPLEPSVADIVFKRKPPTSGT